MIIKINIAGISPIRLELASELTQQLHVSRKKDKYDRRVTTSWITGITKVTLERNHSNKNSKDVDGLIYIGRSFQQYMDKFDADVGFRLAGVRAFTKFFSVNGKTAAEAAKLAEEVMHVVIANKDKESVTFGGKASDVSPKTVKALPATKRGRKAKSEKAEAKSVASPAKKRGRPRKAVKAESQSVASPARKRGRPRKQLV